MNVTTTLRCAAASALLAATVTIAAPVSAHTVGIHDNCTELHKKWPHGVGTAKAVDRTSGKRVTSFYHNSKAYWAAENHNGTLDADNDRIACEQA